MCFQNVYGKRHRMAERAVKNPALPLASERPWVSSHLLWAPAPSYDNGPSWCLGIYGNSICWAFTIMSGRAGLHECQFPPTFVVRLKAVMWEASSIIKSILFNYWRHFLALLWKQQLVVPNYMKNSSGSKGQVRQACISILLLFLIGGVPSLSMSARPI